MDAYSLSRCDLGLLAAAATDRKLFASLIFGAIISERGLDVQIERAGRDYVVVMTETVCDVVVAEHRLPIMWSDLDEVVRLAVLKMYVEGVLAGHPRWRRRMAPRLAALRVTTPEPWPGAWTVPIAVRLAA